MEIKMYFINSSHFFLRFFFKKCLLSLFSRVSEEKEESVRRLKDEQGNFECKIQQLEQQNQIIAQERESILSKQADSCNE